MEENNNLKQSHSGNTPPPVPQPATPPPFVAPDGGDEKCGQMEKTIAEAEEKYFETAEANAGTAEAQESQQVQNAQHLQEAQDAQEVHEIHEIQEPQEPKNIEEVQEDQEAQRVQEESPASPSETLESIPSPAQMERLMKETDRELEAFDAKPLANAGILVRAFSFKGRITRAEYLISHALIPLHFMLVAYVANVASEIASFSVGAEAAGSLYNRLMLFSGLFMFCWFYTAQGVKRCHDVGWSGWWFYVPFINIPLFFKKSRPETNRYGLPASLRATNAEDATAATLVRRRGIWCAATWLICSPVYLFLTWRWKIQRLFARLVMLLVSPFIISVGYTSQVAHKQAKIARTHEARAIGFLSEDNLGVALPVDEAEWRGRERFTGADTYDISFSKALTESDYKRIAALAEDKESGWVAYQDEEEADSDGDYGYYMEDYGTSAKEVKAKAPTCFRFTKTLKGRKKREFNVTLTILKQEKEAKLTVQAAK